MIDTDSFKFIPTILAAVIAFFSILYSQRSSIHITWYSPAAKLITILLISQLFISAYDLIKGVNLKDFPIGTSPDKYANDIYFTVVLMAIVYSQSPIRDLISVSFQKPIPYKYYIFVLLMIFIGFWTYYKNIEIYNIKVYILFIISIIIILFIIAFPMLNRLIFVLFQGHIKINMDNIYYKNSAPIPVSIEITGVNDNLSIDLYKSYKSSVNKLIKIDNINLKPNNNVENIYGNNLILFGNGFYSGKYYIFINTTNMREGYYELVYYRSIDKKYPYGKSFYLMNNGSN